MKSQEFKKYDYRLVVCHIPVVFINSRKNHQKQKEKMTELLNQMDIDMMISGHQHDLYVFEPDTVEYNEKGKMVYNPEFKENKTYGGKVTEHNFLNLLVSKRGKTQTDSASLTNMRYQIGMSTIVDFTSNTQTCIYNTSDGSRVNIVNPFAKISYGDELVFDLNTKKHK